MSFGDDVDEGFETGTLRHHDADPLPHEERAETLNLVEHPLKTFTLPFYYGLIDGDGDLTTDDDTMVYVVMFDQTLPIRFAMWNFFRDDAGNADPHSPAWDWQYVIRSPTPGSTYGYRCRILYKPFVSADAVRADYEAWRRS